MFLLVTPLEREARGLRKALREGDAASRASVAVLGVMGRNAMPVLESMIAREKPEAVISLGFAGALDESLQAGDMVLGARTAFCNEAGSMGAWYKSEEALLARARESVSKSRQRYVEGDIITTSSVVGDPAEKGRLRSATRGVAVDMESSWIAQVTANAGLPVLLARVVLDAASLRLPKALMMTANSPDWLQWIWGGLVAFFSPWNIPAMMELKRCSGVAEENLATFLKAFLRAEAVAKAGGR